MANEPERLAPRGGWVLGKAGSMIACGVTGAAGYVGSVIVRAFRERGVRVVEFCRGSLPPGSTVRPFDLRRPIAPAALEGLDALVHCAYDFAPGRWPEIREVNVEGTRRLFRAAFEAGARRLLLISTISAFPGCRSLYGRAKLEMEALASEFGAIVVRPGLVYGKKPGGILGSLDKLLRIPWAVPIVGSGNAIQYTAHEEDLGRLVVRLVMEAPASREGPIVAACERGYTLRRIMAARIEARGRRARFICVPACLVTAALRAAEQVGFRSRLRYDSLVSLLNQNPAPDFSGLRRLDVAFRPFVVERGPEPDVAGGSGRA